MLELDLDPVQSTVRELQLASLPSMLRPCAPAETADFSAGACSEDDCSTTRLSALPSSVPRDWHF